MEVRRTVRIDLDVTPEAAELLHETIEQFLWAANRAVDVGWDADGSIETRRTTLHEATYDAVREAMDLQASLVQTARNRAAEALAGVAERRRQGQAAGKPTFTSPTLRYTNRSATIRSDHATLATVAGRVRVAFRLPSEPEGTPHAAYLHDDAHDVTGADLVYDETADRFVLHVRTTTINDRTPSDSDDTTHSGDDAAPTAEHRTVLGVDVGIEHLAVTSTGRFWRGAELQHRRREFERRRASFQQRGTRWAHDAMQRIGQREAGYYDDVLHTVSKEVVAEALAHSCAVIAVEDLTGIRDRLPGDARFHAWAFRQLYTYIRYKARAVGLDVIQVDPAHTSQRCSRCGHTARANRRSQSRFVCGDCGYALNADYNAAKNIGLRYLRAAQTSSPGGAPVGVRLHSGTLTADGTYVPADGPEPRPR